MGTATRYYMIKKQINDGRKFTLWDQSYLETDSRDLETGLHVRSENRAGYRQSQTGRAVCTRTHLREGLGVENPRDENNKRSVQGQTKSKLSLLITNYTFNITREKLLPS